MLSLAGCSDLDTKPLSQYLTTAQKDEVKKDNPEMGRAAITGIAGLFSSFEQVLKQDNDFGYPAVMLFSDARAVDMVSPYIGYNWFSSGVSMNDCDPASDYGELAWQHLYRQIFACNAALGGLDKDSDNPETLFYIAQAHAFRAYDYFMLCQIFQFTYVGNEDKPGVMLITEQNEAQAAAEGCARSSLRDCYAQILTDINTAIELLEESGMKPENILTASPKRLVSLAAAYGIRARVNLVMNNWEAAANDAKDAINKFSGQPSPLAETGKPSLNSLDESNWMWGIPIAPTDEVVQTGIINWPSHMGSFCYGYITVGVWRQINASLFAQIPKSDVRRNWFLDEDSYSAGLTTDQQSYCDAYSMPAYTQVKFAPYQGVLGTDNNSNDIPLMRIEEMHYILAEATAMNGGDGATLLNTFVNTYRDPKFKCTGSGEDVQEACWMQRRVEFFGEGITTFDLMRLKKPFDRRGGGWNKLYCYNIEPTDNVLVLPIPESEVNGNKMFSNADNNPSAPKPTAVSDN